MRSDHSPSTALLRITCLLIALAMGCASGNKQASLGLPSRHSIRDDQLMVLSDEGVDENSPVMQELNLVREQIRGLLEVPPAERDVVVYLFEDQDRYSRYMHSEYPELPPRRAFFIGTPQELAVYAFRGDQMLVDLRHEYTHGLLHASVGHIPLWLDEGLAEYFEVGSRQPGGINGEHTSGLRHALAQGWQPDLAELERLEDVNQMHRGHYQESWAWIHFLMHEVPYGREIVADYLRDIRLGIDPGSFADRVRAQLPSADVRLASYVQMLSS